MGDFVFPNELHVTWTVMIVLYPYITGLVAGAFIVASLFHVFGLKQLEPISRFSLVSSFAFLLFATLPLLNHLGQPGRAFNIMITPNFTSAMSGFGFVYLTYTTIVILEIWFHYRADFVDRYNSSSGLWKTLCSILLLGCTLRNDETDRIDHKIVKTLAGIGIPVACILHGYVGFLFGSIKANPWWSTPLMFIIFIFSAIVSGIAVLTFQYIFVNFIKRQKIDQNCLDMMVRFLWGFMIIAVVLEMMDLLSLAYEQTERWAVLKYLITGPLWYTYVVGQILIGSLGSFLLLATIVLFKIPKKISNVLIFLTSGLLLIQVLLMRWNVVIGGQLVSKSYRGFTSFMPGYLEKEGIIVAVIIFIVPFLLLRQFDRIFPFFPASKQKISG
jgi:predicted membrane protein